MDAINLHDFRIDRLDLDFAESTAKMSCTFEDGKTKKEVIFSDFLGAKLEDVTAGSIIMDIESWTISSFIENQKSYLEKRLNYGWPTPAKDLTELEERLVNSSYKVWCIFATLGITGFIIAKDMELAS